MKILFLTNSPPGYPSNGAVIQTHHFMRLLADQHQIGLLSFSMEDNPDLGLLRKKLSFVHIEPRKTAKNFTGKLKRWARWISGHDPMARWSYDGNLLEKILEQCLEKFPADIIIFEQLHMSYPLIRFSKKSARPLLVFNAHDAIHIMLGRALNSTPQNFLANILNQRFINVVRNFEWKVACHADLVLAVSEVDAKHLKLKQLAKDWEVTANGVDTGHFQSFKEQVNEQGPRLVFIGSLQYGPNKEAIEYYIRTIHPKIHNTYPHYSLTIIGGPTDSFEKYFNMKGIEFVGFQRDFRPLFEKAHISIVPLLSGSGTRFKILESWAMGRPVVSTTIGAEGLDYIDGENLLIADDPELFAEHVSKLFRNPELREKISRNGRQLVEQSYSWGSIVDHLNNKLSTTMTRRESARRN